MIDYELLKISLLDGNNLAGKALTLDLTFVPPGLEPFCYITLSAPSDLIKNLISLHFRKKNTDHFYFLNFPADFASRAAQTISTQHTNQAVVTVAATLTLDDSPDWQLVLALPDNHYLEVGQITKSIHGQWKFSKLAENSRIDSSQTKYGLIGGAPKSGTTWVQKIINSHPKALATGENAFFENPHPRNLVALHKKTPPATHARALNTKSTLYINEVASIGINKAERHLKAIGACGRYAFVCDKTPGNSRFLNFPMSGLPDWKIIHVVRHPLDVLTSLIFHEKALVERDPTLSFFNSFWNVRSDFFSESPFGFVDLLRSFDPRTKIGDALLSDNNFFDALIDWYLRFLVPEYFTAEDNFYCVRYEDLTSDFDTYAQGIFKFVGLDTSAQLIEDIKQNSSFEFMSGGRSPGEEMPDNFFRNGEAGDHVRHFTEGQKRYFWSRLEAKAQWSLEYQLYYRDFYEPSGNRLR
jgi:hypothetical protein